MSVLKRKETKRKTNSVDFVCDDAKKIEIIAALHLAYYTKPEIMKKCYKTGVIYPFFLNSLKDKEKQKLTLFQYKKGDTVEREFERLYKAAKTFILSNLVKKDKTMLRAEIYNILTNKITESMETNNNQLLMDCVKQLRQLNGLDIEDNTETENKDNIINNITIDLKGTHDFLEYSYEKAKENKENGNNIELLNKDKIQFNLIQDENEKFN